MRNFTLAIISAVCLLASCSVEGGKDIFDVPYTGYTLFEADFENVDMLDLFAGTGGIGIEFISRGAREVTAVEMAHTQQNFIISACKQLGIKNLHVIRGDVFKYVKACHIQYDFIYADPPYDLELLPTIPDLVFEQNILKEGGYFVLEHSKNNNFSEHPHFLEEPQNVQGSAKRRRRSILQ